MNPAPHFLTLHETDAASLIAEAIAGLRAPSAQVSPKFLYDPLGSRLFDAITELDEYYPTRTEAQILRDQGDAIGIAVHRMLGPAPTLIDLGAGNCAKAARLFGRLQPAHYVALDISVDFLRESMAQLQLQHPAVRMTGVGLDFSSHLALPEGLLQGPSLLFYPGSSIGNFAPPAALRLLRQAQQLSAGGALLIGVDLVKSTARLQEAYDDALGVTGAFNLNLLRHLNGLLDSDFNLRQWQHVALFNEADSRIEMHLQAREELVVQWPGGERRFAARECIHTENSYKWRVADFKALLHDAGFAQVQCWTDAQGWFAVMLAQATPPTPGARPA